MSYQTKCEDIKIVENIDDDYFDDIRYIGDRTGNDRKNIDDSNVDDKIEINIDKSNNMHNSMKINNNINININIKGVDDKIDDEYFNDIG